MEPKIDLWALVTVLAVCNALIVYRTRRGLRTISGEMSFSRKKLWFWISLLIVFVNVFVLWFTGFLALWLNGLRP